MKRKGAFDWLFVPSEERADLPVDYAERGRSYLTSDEIERLLKGSKRMRHPERNYLLLLMMYRHGLRATEATNIRMKDLSEGMTRLWVRRMKGGLSVEHPIEGDEQRAIKRYLRKRPFDAPYLFINERGEQMTRKAVYYIVSVSSKKAGIVDAHPHMLRHSCGYYLANKGYDVRLIQDYLGHRDPRHTVRYTQTSGKRFIGLWD